MTSPSSVFRIAGLFPALVLLVASCSPSPETSRVRSNGSEQPAAYAAGGTVLGVERGSPTDPATHVHLVLRPGAGEPVRVDLGPGWYLDEHGLSFSKDDVVEVEGHRQQHGESQVIVARRVRKGGVTLELEPSCCSSEPRR